MICRDGHIFGRAIPKRCSRYISEPYYGTEYRLQNWAEVSEPTARDGFDVVGGEMFVPLDPFSLAGRGIYKRSFTSKSTELLQIAKVHFHSAERVVSLETEARKKEVLGKVSIIVF